MDTPEVLALEDFIQEGRDLEALIRITGDVHLAQRGPAREKAERCRLIALG